MKFLILATLVSLMLAGTTYYTVKYETGTTDAEKPCFHKWYTKWSKGKSIHESDRWKEAEDGEWQYNEETCSEGTGFDNDGKFYWCDACPSDGNGRAEGETLSSIKCY